MAEARRRKPRVLITNDDGPPTDASGSSPFVYPFARAIAEQLGWEVKVVVPSTQKSWVGKSYLIAEITSGAYFYPTGKDGTSGEKTDLPRALDRSKGEDMEWVLVDGTPATCSNLALHSLFPPESFDLAIAGPNFGRNTSTAFALSSGTIGSAMAASLSGIPSIALSFGLMTGYKPPGEELVNGAIRASCQIVQKLWELGWGEGSEKVDVYSVNVPLLPDINKAEGPTVQWTYMARTRYGRLFKSIAAKSSSTTKEANSADTGGPSAIPEDKDENTQHSISEEETVSSAVQLQNEHHSRPLKFVFAPDIGPLVNPSPSTLEEGTDTHALHSGAISVTPIRAGFEPAKFPSGLSADGLKWNL